MTKEEVALHIFEYALKFAPLKENSKECIVETYNYIYNNLSIDAQCEPVQIIDDIPNE